MKITLLGKTSGYSIQRLAEEAEMLGVNFQAVSLQSLIIGIKDNSFSITSTTDTDISTSDCFMFRAIGDADQEVMVIAKYLARHGAVIIEEKTAYGALMMDKLFLQASSENVPTPNYSMVQSKESLVSVVQTLTYPVVMKSTIGSMGKNVAMITDENTLLEQYEKLGKRVILQEYLPVTSDVRAIVIGGAYVGAYERTRDDDEFRMNRPGNTKKKIDLPAEAVEICEHAASSQNIEIAGVDMVLYENTWYVIEINTSPQFKQFEKYVGVNVPKLIIEYAISKVSNKN